MTEEKKRSVWENRKLIMGICEDCGWYKDCPVNYKCPPLELIITLILEDEEDE